MQAYDEGNIFAKILRGEIPSQRVHEDADAVAIMDAMPQSKGHCLIIPRAASRNLLDADPDTLATLLPLARRLARAVVAAFGADGVTLSQFNEAAAGQTVFHLHLHVIPRYAGVPLAAHGGGMADAAVLAEHAARIRSALERG